MCVVRKFHAFYMRAWVKKKVSESIICYQLVKQTNSNNKKKKRLCDIILITYNVFIIVYINKLILICKSIIMNNPLKASFCKKKYPITIQSHPTQIFIIYFLLKTVLKRIFKDYCCKNHLPITFC